MSYLLISTEAPLDSLISYLTDFTPLVKEHATWLAASHRDGDAFVSGVAQSFAVVLEGSVKAAKERAEAVAATEAQNDALVAGAKLAGWVRDQGTFISGELADSNDPNDQLEARRVRVACGVGSRVNTNRQTGLRKLLAVQKQGLVDVKATWVKWKKDPETAQKVAQAFDRIQASIERQGKEKVEADMAQDELEELAKIAIRSANRVLRLVNAAGDATPATLATGVGSFQAQHGNVFWRQGQPGAPDEPELPVEPGAPVEPATPVDPATPVTPR